MKNGLKNGQQAANRHTYYEISLNPMFSSHSNYLRTLVDELFLFYDLLNYYFI